MDISDGMPEWTDLWDMRDKCKEMEERMSLGFMLYRRKAVSELRPYVEGESLDGVSVSEVDRKAGSPKPGDMIARNPQDYKDLWLVSEKYFKDNFIPLD